MNSEMSSGSAGGWVGMPDGGLGDWGCREGDSRGTAPKGWAGEMLGTGQGAVEGAGMLGMEGASSQGQGAKAWGKGKGQGTRGFQAVGRLDMGGVCSQDQAQGVMARGRGKGKGRGKGAFQVVGMPGKGEADWGPQALGWKVTVRSMHQDGVLR